MKVNNQNIKNKDRLKEQEKESVEIAAEKLAEIIIAWIELNQNKDKNVYEKRK